MPDHHLIIAAGPQRLATIPLDARGRPVLPSSASFGVVDLRRPDADPARVLAEGLATVDPAAQALTAPAGRGTTDPRALRLSSAEGLATGRRYLLRHGPKAELVRVELLDVDSQTARLESELAFYFDAGAELRGVEVSATFPAELADADEARDDAAALAVDWTFEASPDPAAAVPRPSRELIHLERLVRAQLGSVSGVLGIDQQLTITTGPRKSIDRALVQANREIEGMLAGQGERMSNLGIVGDLAAEYLALHLIYATEGSAYAERASWARRHAERYLDELRHGPKPRDAVETSVEDDTAVKLTPRRVWRAL